MGGERERVGGIVGMGRKRKREERGERREERGERREKIKNK